MSPKQARIVSPLSLIIKTSESLKNFKKVISSQNHLSVKIPTKKQLTDNLNFSSTVRAPLEIINEYHREHSIETFPEIIVYGIPPSHYSVRNDLQIINNLKNSAQYFVPNINHSSNLISKKKKELSNSINNVSESFNSQKKGAMTNLKLKLQTSCEVIKEKSNVHLNTSSSNFLYKNGNSNLIDSHEIENLRKDTSFLPKNKYKKTPGLVTKINEINIFSLFSEKRILHGNDGII